MRTKIATWLTGIFAVLACINYLAGHFSGPAVFEDRMAFFWKVFAISAVYGLIVAGGSFIRYADDLKITEDEFAKIFQNGIITMFAVGLVLMFPRTFCISEIETCVWRVEAAIGMIQVVVTVVLLGCGVWFIGRAFLVGAKQSSDPKEDEKKKKEADQRELDRAVGELNRVKKEAVAKIAEVSKKLNELGYGGGDGSGKKKGDKGGEKKDEKGSAPKESGS